MKKDIDREDIVIDKGVLRDIIRSWGTRKNTEFKLIEDVITNSDIEDGGADHEVVIKRLSDNKYFYLEYSDWDMDYNFDRDFPENLMEVFPEEKTITVYV